MKKRKKIIIWALILIIVPLVLIISRQQYKGAKCNQVVIELNGDGSGYFLNKSDIMAYIFEINDSVIGHEVSSIDVIGIENALHAIPYISEADAFVTVEGDLKVRVEQRKAIARVFNSHKEDFYIAEDGVIMPFSAEKPQKLCVVNGHIPDKLKSIESETIDKYDSLFLKSSLPGIYQTIMYIQKDALLESMFTQIYIEKNGDISLIPVLDDHKVLIGNADSLNYKFKKLLTFYQKGMIRTGWDKYETINLKHSNQVICTKK